jgi:nicotinamidase/pyrazinamidase
MKKTKALLIVDVQRDFCPGGALPVPHGDQVVPVLNEYIKECAAEGLPVLASRDWHPHRTRHFKEFGGPWPVHCVQNTPGAAFHSDLRLPKNTVIISKGQDPDKDGYTAFEGRDEQGQFLKDILEDLGTKELFVGGLATDYCVKASALDARKNGFKVFLLSDAVRGVDLHPDDSKKALEEMSAQGIKRITRKDFRECPMTS